MIQEYKLTKPYSKGSYNKCDEDIQWIRLTEGCPHKHPYCAESFENPEFKVYQIPEIVRNKVNILDMNLLCHKEALEIIKELGRIKVNGKVVYYSLQCGIDFRFLTPEIALALKRSRFKDMRIAWDLSYKDVYKIFDAKKMLEQVGYDPKRIQVFMVCNWRTSYIVCLKKLETLKFWNMQVADCWFDNQKKGEYKPLHWTLEQMKDFGKKCRDHNIMARHNGMQVEEVN